MKELINILFRAMFLGYLLVAGMAAIGFYNSGSKGAIVLLALPVVFVVGRKYWMMVLTNSLGIALVLVAIGIGELVLFGKGHEILSWNLLGVLLVFKAAHYIFVNHLMFKKGKRRSIKKFTDISDENAYKKGEEVSDYFSPFSVNKNESKKVKLDRIVRAEFNDLI